MSASDSDSFIALSLDGSLDSDDMSFKDSPSEVKITEPMEETSNISSLTEHRPLTKPSQEGFDIAQTEYGPLEEINSFLPVFQKISNFAVCNNVYRICGVVSKADVERLTSYANRVSKLTFNDTSKPCDPCISPESFLRLALLQNPGVPLFPSLRCIRISDGGPSLDYFFLCITPSLKSLEIENLPELRQEGIASFLTVLVKQVSSLSHIKFGLGNLSDNLLQVSLKLTHLRRLEFVQTTLPFFDFNLLKNIASLPELEELILNVVGKQYQPHSNQNTLPLLGGPVIDFTSDSFQKASSGAKFLPRLRKLALTGRLELMGDLIFHLAPEMLEHVSLSFISSGTSSSWSIPPPSWYPSVPAQHVITVEPNIEISTEEDKSPEHTLQASEEPAPEREDKPSDLNHSNRKSGQGKKLKKSEELKKRKAMEKEMRQKATLNLGEQIRQAGLTSDAKGSPTQKLEKETTYFAWIVEQLLKRYALLNTLFISHSLSFDASLPSEVVQKALSCDSMVHLNIKGWTLESLDVTLANLPVDKPWGRLETLELPTTETNAISISTLRFVAQCCPLLTRLECFLNSPAGADSENLRFRPETDSLSHELKSLSVAGPIPSLDVKMAIAVYIYYLFPDIQSIQTPIKTDIADWEDIHKLYKMCRTAGTVDRNRSETDTSSLSGYTESLS